MLLIKVLSFYIGGECFAADVTGVRRLARRLEVTPVPAAPPEVAGIAGMRGKVVTLLRYSSGAHGAPAELQAANAILFKTGGESEELGLIVDRPGDLVEIDEATLTPPPSCTKAADALPVSRVSEADGVLYRVIDIDSIINRFRKGPQGGALNE